MKVNSREVAWCVQMCRFSHVREHAGEAVVNVLIAAISDLREQMACLKSIQDGIPRSGISHAVQVMQLNTTIVASSATRHFRKSPVEARLLVHKAEQSTTPPHASHIFKQEA